MPFIISGIRIGLNDDENYAIKKAISILKVNESDIKFAYINKKSLDARKRDNISFVISVVVSLNQNENIIAKNLPESVSYKQAADLTFDFGQKMLSEPIVIVGFGPAGLFASYVLSSMGYKVIVIERGECIEKRNLDVNAFWGKGVLSPESNVQFGEGGAGTFSDGKLTTRISDSRCYYILQKLVEHGAPKEILQTSKPHIGTDILKDVVVSMRKHIIKMGGDVRFNNKLDDFIIKNSKVIGAIVNGQEIKTNNIILAIGHSSRDTFEMLFNKGVPIENKPFSVGVRIEQLQSKIEEGLYGNLAGHKNLPKGEYQLSHKIGDKCVYTFCMCPGGYVVPSSSSNGMLVTNGMSEYARDAKNANSGLVVSVNEYDYGNEPLAGIKYQENLERLAFIQGGNNYKAPIMLVGDFLENTKKHCLGNVIPSYSIGTKFTDFNSIFGDNIIKMLKQGLNVFENKLHGFSDSNGILTGVETRTSSPIRILRGEEMSSILFEGLYPCGEGAGYAGGIMSAAVDGIRVAQSIISKYKHS